MVFRKSFLLLILYQNKNIKHFYGYMAIALLVSLGSCGKTETDKTFGVLAEQGMVVSANPLASEIGLEVLKSGGNAFDAAIAVKYALAVTYPVAGNIGGGGFMVYRTADGDVGALDFRETAPLEAYRDMYLDESGNVLFGLSRIGHLSAGVPGTVAGMDEVYSRFGTLPFENLIQPAIDLAQKGYVNTAFQAEQINRFQFEFSEVNTQIPHLVRDESWAEGDTIYFKDLAKTLERIRDFGRDGFYTGETADLIVQEMEAGGGIITRKDLIAYEAVWREPISIDYKNYRVISMPPSSSGGVAVAQLMLGSEAYDFSEMGHNSAGSIHIMTELMRRVFADRATYMGDTDFVEVPIQELLDKEYIRSRNASINPDKATPSTEIKEGEVSRIESFETTHFSIVDPFGNAVSITTTINSYFGSKVMVAGAGFFLNNEMDDFSAKPGVANQFGLIGGEANAIIPGKRMLSSMTPTIVEKDGNLFLILGTPGGSTIITNVYQVIMNVLEHDMTMQEAVNARKIHAQWLPDMIVMEEGAADSLTVDSLQDMGHMLNIIPQIGRFQAIMKHENGRLEGAADITRTGDSTAKGF